MPQKVNTDLHVALGQARVQQQAAQEQCNLAEINLHKEVASRQLADAAMQRAQQELADASAERCESCRRAQVDGLTAWCVCPGMHDQAPAFRAASVPDRA